MVSKSAKANSNYCARIIQINNLRKHSNADRLQCTTIDGRTVITDLSTKEGDVVVYFPVECAINKEFISHTNSFKEKSLNRDPEQAGFFEENCRVKALKLRGEASEGFIIPVSKLEDFMGFIEFSDEPPELKNFLDQEFDLVYNVQICTKYIPKNSGTPGVPGSKKDKTKSTRLQDIMVDDQFKFHEETDQLGKNVHKINPTDNISVTYKLHGSSAIISNVLVKRRLTWIERLLKKFGANIEENAYGYIYSSGKPKSRLPKGVLVDGKQGYKNKNKDYYSSDIWKDVMDQYKHALLPGVSIYGEIVGFDANGRAIQKDYDYGCAPKEHKFFVYRINYTNVNGNTIELSFAQIKEYCAKYGLIVVPEFYNGLAAAMYDFSTTEQWHTNFLNKIIADYNNKECHMCLNKVPAEGVVVRVDKAFSFEAYKQKSSEFLRKETKDLDAGVVDMETAESLEEIEQAA